MGKRIKKILTNFLSILGTIQSIRAVSEVVVVVAAMGIAVREWVEGLDTFQEALLIVIMACVSIVAITYVVDYRRKRSVHYIPELLRQMNIRLEHLIKIARIPEPDKIKRLSKDAGELFTLDMSQLETLVNLGNFTQIKGMIRNVGLQATQLQASNFVYLLVSLAGLMDYHRVGLASIKNGDEEYSMLENKLHILKDRIHNARTKEILNSYLLWRDGIYSFKLLRRYNCEQLIPEDILPAQAKGLLPLINPIIDAFLEAQLSKIEEAISGKGE